MKTPILGSSYVTRSVNAADNRMVNLFPEIIPLGGKEPAFLSRAPGLAVYKSTGAAFPIRGMITLYNIVYVVSGSSLYSMSAPNFIPTLVSGGGIITGGTPAPVSMADNGTQIFIATDGGDAYVYNTITLTFIAMSAGIYPNFPGATTVAFIDGFFLVNQPNSQKVWSSALYDGTTWSSTAFASAEKFSDNVVGVCAAHGELWVFGTNSTEVWYNAGNANFAFAPIQGAFSEIGCASPYSVAKMDNTIYWLSSDSRGNGIVYKARGYTGERVSTHAVEWQIQSKSLNTAVAYTYQQGGHSFYVLNASSSVFAATTWVYDVATQSWHERQSFDVGSGTYSRHWGNCQCTLLINGILINLVGDFNYTGSIFKLDLLTYADYNTPQRWLRSWRALPPDQNTLNRMVHHSLQLDCEAGGGIGVNPQVSLRFSDDGGHTWSNYRSIGMGIAGAYDTRVIWKRLGITTKLRDRVYEVSGTDPTPITIMGAELIASNTSG